jgi:hypothetical protein
LLVDPERLIANVPTASDIIDERSEVDSLPEG